MIRINLLPKEARKRVGVTEQIVIIVVVLILTVAGIIFWLKTLNGIIEQKQTQIAQTKQRLAELQKIIDEIKAFEAQRAALERKLEIIAKLQKEQQVPVHLLDHLYLALVDDMWLNSFSEGGGRISLSGSALSHPVVSNYLRSVENSPFFANVELGGTSLRTVGNQEVRNFSVTAGITVPEDLGPGESE